MSAVLSEAENKFFSSGGSDVDPSLKPAEAPAESAPAMTTTPAATPPTPAPATTTSEPTQQQVPLAALHEERQKRVRVEQERQALQQQLQQFQQALEQAQKAQQAPPPDPNQDPIGAALHETQATKAQLEELRQWRAQQEQLTQENNLRQQFHQTITNSEATFRAKQPDYDQALNYAMQQYDKLLSAVIPDPAARRQRVYQEAIGAAYTVMSEGRDPAQFLYDTARNMGYTPAQAAAAATTPTLPQVPQTRTTADVVKTIEKGLKQQANPGGGATPAGEISPEMALTLPGDEFNKWWAKQFRR
jgi:hypothetical protein